jgi:prophage DNA circulation protein
MDVPTVSEILEKDSKLGRELKKFYEIVLKLKGSCETEIADRSRTLYDKISGWLVRWRNSVEGSEDTVQNLAEKLNKAQFKSAAKRE